MCPRFMCLFFCWILLKLCTAVVYFEKPCPKVQVVAAFDIDRILGSWYQLARYENDLEENEHCIKVSYIRNDSQYIIRINGIIDKKRYSYEGHIRTNNGTGIVYFQESDFQRLENTDEIPVSVLGVDYDKYIIFYDCQYDTKSNIRHDYFWIASKFKNYKGEIKNEIDNFLKSTPFIDTSKLIWADFSNEQCEIQQNNSQ